MAKAPTRLLDRFRDPLADPDFDRRRIRLAAMMGTTGVAHFVVPAPFRRIVPNWFPWPDRAVALSGAAEVVSAALMLNPPTKRVGGALAVGTLLGVYPANIQMALDATRSPPQRGGFVTTAVLWLRLPLQWPMISTALRLARS